MLSETLAKGLGHYAIGDKLRALRLKKKIGLVELGRHTGLSAAMLSRSNAENFFRPYRRSYASPWCSA
jgi:hypothetical protein